MNYGSILKISAIFFCINSVAVGQFSQFHIGIYTEDFYQPIRLNPASCNYALINNSNFVGHDPTYIRSLSPDYITLIVPWSEHFKPIRKLYSNVPGRHYLDDCLFWGIKVALTTPDFHYDNGLNPIVDVAEIGNAYTYYYHPAIDAIHISDETGYENFSILNALHNQLSILGARSFSNLLPLYASTKQLQYGKNYAGNDGLTATPSNYRYYIERFLASNPKNLAFDYYVEFDFLMLKSN